jgi:serine/threonine protein kinase
VKGPGSQSLVQTGDVVDDYVVGKLFAKEGGMALLYLVEDPGLPKLPLVMKVLPADSPPDMVARMEREAYALSMLSSARHVVRIHKTGRCPDGSPYIVLEKLSGEDLHKLFRRERQLSIARAVEITVQASMGLHACHVAGVLHRDIKPANLFLHQEAELGEVVKIIDFGISHLGTGPAITSLNATSGTRRYMAPEQARGHDDERADQFSLAAVLFEMLAGELPWPIPRREDGGAHERLVAGGQFKRLRALRPDVPEELEATVMRALSPAPERRWVSVFEFARTLLPFAGPQVQAVFGRYADKALRLGGQAGDNTIGGARNEAHYSGEMSISIGLPARRDDPRRESEYATVSNGGLERPRLARRRLLASVILIGVASAAVPAWLRWGPRGASGPVQTGTGSGQGQPLPSDTAAAPTAPARGRPDDRQEGERTARAGEDSRGAEPSSEPSVESRPPTDGLERQGGTGSEQRATRPAGKRKPKHSRVKHPPRTPQGTAIVE